MRHLIDKDELLAEINKRIVDAPINNIGHQRVWAYNDVKDIIGALAVKDPWKPTDEQLEAVKCAALDVSKFSSRSEQLILENEPYYKALDSLYQDLKKLKE